MTIISPQLGISPTATTGGETYDRELLKQLVKMRKKVEVLLPRGKQAPKELVRMGIDRTFLGHFVPPYTFNLFSLPWALNRLNKNRPCRHKDCHCQKRILRIHSPEYLFPTVYAVKKLRPDIPIVAHYHLDQTGWLSTKTNRVVLNMVDAVIADSEYLKERLINRVGVDEKLIHVIHCGVDVEAIKPKSDRGLSLRSKGKSGSNKKVLLYLGRFIKRKRPDIVINVFAKLHKKYPNTRLIMIGEGPDRRSLELQVENFKLQNAVEFPGPLFEKEKLKKYHQADLFIFPSEKEGFVLVVLEAMAAGLPLLVPDTLGFPEAVQDGKNGLLAKSNNIGDWVSKAEKILFNTRLNRVMRKKSREIAIKQFSWRRCAKRNLRVYESVVQ